MSGKFKLTKSGLRTLFCAVLAGALVAGIAVSSTAAPSTANAPQTDIRISSSSTHTLAVSGGALYGWGTNQKGQLPSVSVSLQAAPVKLAEGVADAAASANRSLVVFQDGRLLVYGEEPGSTVKNGVVVASDAVQVDASDSFAAYVSKTGALYTWGRNTTGQLGNGTDLSSDTPVRIFDSGAKKVSVGDMFALALMQDGTVYGWGANSEQQLGGSSTEMVLRPVKVASGVADIAAGGSHSCLLFNNGILSTCGSNLCGQTGVGEPVTYHGLRQILTGVASVSAGSRHTFAISNDGKVSAWGSSVSGQLGLGGTERVSVPRPTSFDFISVFCDGDSTFAVTSENKIASFGDNTNYVLGKADGSDSLRPMVILDSEMNWVFEEENPVAGPASLEDYLNQVEGKDRDVPDENGETGAQEGAEEGSEGDHNHVIDNPGAGESETVETRAKAFISGDGSGNFYPDKNVTRAQFLRMIVYSLYEDFDPEKDYGPSQFSDVADRAWYRNFVAFAEQVGLVHGDEEGHFRPNDPISRGDASVLVSLALQLDTDSAIPSKFPDVNTTRYYAKHIDALTALGILSGDEEGFFNPTKFITRSQAVTVISRALGFQPDADTKAALLEQFSESPFEDVRPGVWYYAYLLRGVGAVE